MHESMLPTSLEENRHGILKPWGPKKQQFYSWVRKRAYLPGEQNAPDIRASGGSRALFYSC